MAKKSGAQMRKDLAGAERLIHAPARAFRAACQRAKTRDEKSTYCGIYKNLSQAAGSVSSARDFIVDLPKDLR